MTRLEIRLVHGNIVDVDSTAWVLGICQDVTPSGAAPHIDTLLDGAISEFSARLRLQRLQSIDWADYIHYGDWQFSLKT